MNRPSVFTLLVTLLFSGCADRAKLHGPYVGTVLSVDQPLMSTYYPVATGERPLNYIYVRVRRESKEALRQPSVVKIVLLDLYSPQLHGRDGDDVSFSSPLALPLSGELNFDTLVAYKVSSPKAQ